MKRLPTLLFLLAGVFSGSPAFGESLNFQPLHVYVDAGERQVAAYQFEFFYESRAVKIVGIEGGDGALGEAPYYDPKGLVAGRIVIASFTTDAYAPRGRVRVATIHLMVDEDLLTEEGPRARLMAVADPQGISFEAGIDLVRAGEDGTDRD